MNKKKIKAFTLVELIVVMAIFSILMVGVMLLIDPTAKLMKRATLQEANSSAVDNMKRYFEGTLRYAEAIEVHRGDLSYYDGASWQTVSGSDEKDKMEQSVTRFLDVYYLNKSDDSDKPFKGKVRLLKVDNDAGGLVSEYEWNFTSGYTYYTYSDSEGIWKVEDTNKVPTVLSSYVENNNVINPAYYENYEFYIAPGYNELQTNSITAPNNNSYCATLIDSKPGVNTFNKDFFSLSIVTYKKDDGRYVYDSSDASYKFDEIGGDCIIQDDPSTTDVNEAQIFQSPFAISNATMALMNITSDFAKIGNNGKYYAPVRYQGSDGVNNYTTETMVDIKNAEGINESDGKWDYILSGTSRSLCYVNPQVTGNNYYFIYTLPDAE